jgi:hypothetical protein
MPDKPGTNKKPVGRSMSAVVLDFVFGDPLPQPEVVEHDNEQAWQEWLDAKARQESVVDFEDTQPMQRVPSGHVHTG